MVRLLVSGNKRTDREEAMAEEIKNLRQRAQFIVVLCCIGSALLGMASLGLAIIASPYWLILFLVGEFAITMTAITTVDELI